MSSDEKLEELLHEMDKEIRHLGYWFSPHSEIIDTLEAMQKVIHRIAERFL